MSALRQKGDDASTTTWSIPPQMAADIQHDKGRGFQALTRFFDGGVRNRGMRYVGKGAISILESTRVLLAAEVQGRNRYSTAFARVGESIRYGCSCPYFVDSMKACKHLFALALEQSRSALVNDAWTCRMFCPDEAILAGYGDGDDDDLESYQASISKKVVQVGVERATPHLLEALLRLRQAACHPGLIDHGRQHESSAKVECLVERLRALRAEGHRALVFSQFTSLLSIRERLTEEQISFEYLDGKTRDRAGAVERFQSNPSIGAFLISLKAGGVGLNLTAADGAKISLGRGPSGAATFGRCTRTGPMRPDGSQDSVPNSFGVFCCTLSRFRCTARSSWPTRQPGVNGPFGHARRDELTKEESPEFLARGFRLRGLATRLSCPAISRTCGGVGAVRGGDRDWVVTLQPAARDQCIEPVGRRSLPNQPPRAPNGNEPRRRPARSRVVDPYALERGDCASEVRDARVMDRADLALGGAVAARLRALKNARNVLCDRVCRDQAHLRREAIPAGELGLLDCRRRSQRRLHREGLALAYVIQHEALALLGHRAAHVARDRTVAPEDLCAAVVDIERVDAESCDREVPGLAAARWTCNNDHAHARHRDPSRSRASFPTRGACRAADRATPSRRSRR